MLRDIRKCFFKNFLKAFDMISASQVHSESAENDHKNEKIQ